MVAKSGTAVERFQRRLAAVLAMDVAGYSRLMGLDEEGTHKRLIALFEKTVYPLITGFGGRIVKKTGDGALVEFASALEAVRGAVEIQKAIVQSEAETPEERRIRLRIGINVGDIIIEQDDIYGDGVNIAARLEGLAESDGICVSQGVVDHVVGREDFTFVDLGPRTLKNIVRPVQVYKVVFHSRGGAEIAPMLETHVGVAPALLSGPAIAVLPFLNIGRSPDDEFLVDGLTEDIITTLSRWRSFPVIARNSVFAYKNKPIDLSAVTRELSARYLLQGSIRRAGQRLRVSVQLIDGDVGHAIMAERYDREIADVFDLQDELVATIVGAIEPELLKHERELYHRLSQQNLTAYGYLQRGLWHHYRYTAEHNQQARQLLKQSLELHQSARAAAALSVVLSVAATNRWDSEGDAAYAEALRLATLAVQLDGRDPSARFALGLVHYHLREPHAAFEELTEVTRLMPSFAAAHANLAFLHNYFNRPEQAIEAAQTALRLSPTDPRVFMWLPGLAGGLYLARRYEDALVIGRRSLALKPDYLLGLRYVVAALGQLGRVEEAAVVLPLLQQLDPTVAATEKYLRRYYVSEEAMGHIFDGLRRGGMP
jgi:adenylate cyclase